MRQENGQPRAARTLVASLRAHGVDRVFCVAGESYLSVLDELHDTTGIDVVTCRHEGSAGFAAVADSRITGRAGVCLVSRGPGATNAAIAVHSAAQDAGPLVLIVGQVPVGELGREAFQELDCSAAFTGMAKECLLLLDPSRTASFVDRAFRVAESGTPGPVVLVTPEDVLTRSDAAGAGSGRWAQGHAAPGAADLLRVEDLLREARRPLLIAGGLVSTARGRTALHEVADRHMIPVVTSNKRQDLFDNRDPRYAGHLHVNTEDRQRVALDRADLVLAVGTRLDATTTLGHRLPASPLPRQPLVHVYPDAGRLGRVHRPALGLAADPAAFLRDIAALPSTATGERRGWAEELHGIETGKAVWQSRHSDDGLPFGAVVHALDTVTGGDVVVALDAGTHTSWVFRHLRLTGAGRMLGISSSAMGYGLPAGVAAALRLARPVVVVTGDGGFLMTGSELATAVQRSLPVIVLVADNGSYGSIRLHQEVVYPGRTIATDLTNPDFAQLARAYGALGLTIKDEADIQPVLRRALDHGGPVVAGVQTSLTWINAYRRLDSGGGLAAPALDVT